MPVALFAAVFAVGMELGQLILPIGSVGAPAFWPASGVLLAALVLMERRAWAWPIAIAAAIAALSVMVHGGSLLPAVVLPVMTIAQGVAGAWLVRRFGSTPFTLNRVADAFSLVAASVAAACLAVVAVVLVPERALEAWRAWGFSTGLGMLLVAPLVIGWRVEWSARQEFRNTRRTLEFGAVVAGAALVSQLVFGGILPEAVQLPSIVLPFFIWSAFRFGPAGSSLTIAVVCLTGLGYTIGGVGPLAMPGAAIDLPIWRAQAAACMASVSFLLLASMAAERAQALAEVRTLRGFIPICAWCHKVRDDAGFWQRLETYLGDNTDATISHSICPSCAERQEQAVTQQGSAAPWKI